ncbi:tRNA wybutosine-synthesizing protein 3 homolog isoform X2 [Rhipicephalus microplus]|uniref:tRNA wybutosine-synthesizing protein 3 homolog isoform X2 n=1 Tax=Rhipicephalus microplus TaxID=6941 RepID=UPI003F6B6A8A
MNSFAKEKRERLEVADVSRKGTIDSRIINVTDRLNSFPQYCTTSSCSGRIIIFSGAESDIGKPAAKKGCQWHFVTHDLFTEDALDETLAKIDKSATLKFEPFILHVRCHTLDAAQKLLAVSIGAGCRNSGIMLSKSGKVHVYLNFLRKQANEKMTENWRRLQRFSDALNMLHSENEDKPPTRRLHRDTLVARTKTKKMSVAFDYDESISGLFDFAS